MLRFIQRKFLAGVIERCDVNAIGGSKVMLKVSFTARRGEIFLNHFDRVGSLLDP